jgi:hypothetical protein
MPSSSQVRGLMKAMGMQIKEEKKEFVLARAYKQNQTKILTRRF